MPPKQGGGEVGGAEDVKTAAEDGAGYAVKGRCVPRHLRLVDGEMRGDGALAALGREDGVGI